MNPSIEASPQLPKYLKVAVIISAIFVLIFSSTVLTGYLFHSVTLIRFPFSASDMNPTVAFSFLLGGIGVFFLVTGPPNFATGLLIKIIASFFIIEGAGRFMELGGLFDPGLDLVIFPNWFIHTTLVSIPGRMPYTTAFLFILTGISFLLQVSGYRKKRIIQYFLYTIIILSLFNLLSILYGVNEVYLGRLLIFKMELSSSICFFLLGMVFLMVNCDQGIMPILISRKAGGEMAGLFLPLILVFPVLALVYRVMESLGLFQNAVGPALVSVVAMILFMVLIIRTAKSNNILNDRLAGEIQERKKAVDEASKSDLFATVIYDSIPNMVFVKDAKDLLFRSMNKAGEQLIGNSREDLAGKSDHDFFPREEADFFMARDREVFNTNMPMISEERITTKHNGMRWLRTKKIGIKDENGIPLYMIGISEDITELKEKQEQLNKYYAELEEKVKERTQELNKSEKRFYAIIENAPDAMIIADERETIQLVNTQTEILFGYTKKELIGKKIGFLIPDRMIQVQGSSKYWVGQELFAKVKSGQDIPVEISLSPIDTSEGMLISISVRDITRRKKAENTLVENELMFRGLIQNVPGVIYQWIERFDGTYGPIYVSPKLKQYFCLEPEEMDRIQDYIHPDDKVRWRSSIEEASTNGTSWFFEGRLLYPDGQIKWWRGTSVMAIQNEEGRVYNGIMVDITEQKLIGEKILQNQKRYEAIFNSQYQFMGLMTTDGVLIEVNETALNFGGLQAADVIGKPFWESYWWAISERTQARLKQSVANAARGEFIRYETDIIGKGGIIASIDFSIKPVRDDHGKVILLIPEGRDITQRKLLEQKAREQEDQIRLFVKHTPAAVAMFDNQMRYMVVSDRWYRDYGLTGSEIIGRSHYDIFPEIYNMKEWKAIHQRCLAGEVEKREQDPFPRADGSMDWLRWEIHPWKTSNGDIGGIILFTEVITEKIIAQENLKNLNIQLTESNRELEQFAYVASHDLQEPLRMVNSFLQLLDKKYKGQLDDTARKYIHFAVDGSERMKTLINDLLMFSRVRTAPDKPVKVDCNEIVKNLVRLYDEKINETGSKITISRLPVIMANKTQIEQLFQNLVGNALKYRREEAPRIEIGCEEDDNMWKFYIRDNGIGIEPRFFEKVFVIFQRLHGKNEYSGTGIGLAICKKIVELHGGKIWIESEPGAGTTFYFSFPRLN